MYANLRSPFLHKACSLSELICCLQEVSLESAHGDILMKSDPPSSSSKRDVPSFSAWRS